VEAASLGKRWKQREGRVEAGQSSKPTGPWFSWWKRQRSAGEWSEAVSFGRRSSEAPGNRQAGSGFRTWARLRWTHGEGRLRHPVAVDSRAERKRSELLRHGEAERGKSCLATSSSGRRKSRSEEASPERRCKKTLKGNQAQGSSERCGISNEAVSQRTRQWSKALKAAFPGEAQLEVVLATGL